jgi:hypothetical protein
VGYQAVNARNAHSGAATAKADNLKGAAGDQFIAFGVADAESFAGLFDGAESGVPSCSGIGHLFHESVHKSGYDGENLTFGKFGEQQWIKKRRKA